MEIQNPVITCQDIVHIMESFATCTAGQFGGMSQSLTGLSRMVRNEHCPQIVQALLQAVSQVDLILSPTMTMISEQTHSRKEVHRRPTMPGSHLVLFLVGRHKMKAFSPNNKNLHSYDMARL